MTVFKAKGLEFPIVILGESDVPRSRDRPSRHRWARPKIAGQRCSDVRARSPSLCRDRRFQKFDRRCSADLLQHIERLVSDVAARRSREAGHVGSPRITIGNSNSLGLNTVIP